MSGDLLIEQCSRLRWRARCQNPFFQQTEASRAAVRREVERMIVAVQTRGDVARLEGGAALLLEWHEPDSFFGGAIDNVHVDLDPDDPAAVAWLRREIEARAGDWGDALLVQLDVHCRWVLEAFQSRGIHIDAVIQDGAPATALKHIRTLARPDLDALGLEVAPLSTPAQVDAVVALNAAIFSRSPQFCFFGATPEYLAQERARRLGALENDAPDWVLLHRGEVVGHFAGDIHDDPQWGRKAGMIFILAPAWQGKGIVKAAYEIVLRELVARDCDVFRGGTSQPSILALGRCMERFTHTLVLRRGAFFSPDHFGFG